MYNPLPDCLTIEKSDIHGLGLFATCNIWKETNLGIAHINIIGFPHDYCRTPLGGFYNHSDEPNCELRDDNSGYFYVKNLVSIKEIAEGEELTCKYTLYSL
tara:strand:+ start:1324 stop:1626 length:303 start_codon:yes stop_codon:yes gene_type:complete